MDPDPLARGTDPRIRIRNVTDLQHCFQKASAKFFSFFQCSNHLFICDLELGCVCPDGMDCGVVQQISQVSKQYIKCMVHQSCHRVGYDLDSRPSAYDEEDIREVLTSVIYVTKQ